MERREQQYGIERRLAAAERLAERGLYRPETERAACGVGFVARRDGARSRTVVDTALSILVRLTHRGAAGSDPETGDGAGILIQLPHALFASDLGARLPPPGDYALGMFFLPRDPAFRRECVDRVERCLAAEGLSSLAWRDVPTAPERAGRLARETMPHVAQVFVARDGRDPAAFELALYLARKGMRREVRPLADARREPFYCCSFSTRTVVYKGLLRPGLLASFYTDLARPETESALAVVHQRFSTNTFPTWERAHPYRMLAHNGEINTLRGNVNWMRAREVLMAQGGPPLDRVHPVLDPSGTDSAMLDDALELLVRTGRSIPHALAMLVPPAWQSRADLPADQRAFFEVHASLMEPWDGPACVVFTDGRVVGAALDRNGLRPARYTETTDGTVILASETGVVPVPAERVARRGRLGPGGRLLVDTETGQMLGEEDLLRELAAAAPWERWADRALVRVEDLPTPRLDELPGRTNDDDLQHLQRAFGYTREDLVAVIAPAARSGKEPIGAMGNDTPLAVMSDAPRPLFDYFKQLFAQVTNPPIDPLRETLVMSLRTTLGREHDLFAEGPPRDRQLVLDGPILTAERMRQIRSLAEEGLEAVTLSTLFPADEGGAGLERALEALRLDAERAAAAGAGVLVLSDRGVDPRRAPIPCLLATAAVHHHLIARGLRQRVGLVVESGEPREVMHFCLLSGYGAGAVHPYLLLESLGGLVRTGELEGLDLQTALEQTVGAIHAGLRKVLAKMGISTLQSYRGAQIFEALGLSQALVDQVFPGTASRLDGVGLEQIAADVLALHRAAFAPAADDARALPSGGRHQYRRDGERHAYDPNTVALLQHAVRSANRKAFQRFSALADAEGPGAKPLFLRHLLRLRPAGPPVPLEEVEPVGEIVKRFRTGAMSFGSLSAEAHETLAIAMNRLGARSNSGEGGEQARRYRPDPNGDSRRSAIKQVASGRFGVTAEYLAEADELQIKIAQGAKPGEGGQLPGHKVDEVIAATRCSTPGVGLISPPPHHDIYSIEDLAQLIHDLRCANDRAEISVKLVSEVGVGTVAAGVAKAGADAILISGQSGGTGASPLSSKEHAGAPWELGLAEAQQVLVVNDLRGRVRLEVDGQIKTARDVVVAAMLGAERFGFGTAALVATGCILMRVCHLNTCPVGVATQDPELRARFRGLPDHVVNLFVFVAEEVREQLAALGVRTLDELVGRVDLLEAAVPEDHPKARHLDLSRLLLAPDVPASVPRRHVAAGPLDLPSRLEARLLEAAEAGLRGLRPVELDAQVENTDRTVGTRLSAELVRRAGGAGLPDETIRVRLRGSAGQSFGAFVARGITLELEGDANDAVGKGLSGGRLVVRPPRRARFAAEDSVIVGNVALYGATGGSLFVRGRAGERFAVRNSGATAVVEGVGDHGCEYMTGGEVLVLGPTGRNFGAGMSGGLAWVFDGDGHLGARVNREMVDLEALDDEALARVRVLLEEHLALTRSELAWRLLATFSGVAESFVQVTPREYRRVLEARAAERARATAAQSAVRLRVV